MIARVVEDYGRRYVVEADGMFRPAVARKKGADFACGDLVRLSLPDEATAVIEEHLPRRNRLFRSDGRKSKIFAANLGLVAVVVAVEPAPDHELSQRALLAAAVAGIPAVLIVNKNDLQSDLSPWSYYGREMNIETISVSAARGRIEALRRRMQGLTCLLVGQSGVGKSSLTNALLRREEVRTGEVSRSSRTGRHTTTHTRLYAVDGETFLIDSPGVRAFGLRHLAPDDYRRHCPDLAPLIARCRFRDCSHRAEPGCAVKAAAEEGVLPDFRRRFLQNINAEAQIR